MDAPEAGKRPTPETHLYQMSLDEGYAVLTVPAKMTREDVDDFEYWVNGILRTLRRRVAKKEQP